MSSGKTLIYSIQKADAADVLKIEQVYPADKKKSRLPSGYTIILPVVINAQTYLFAQKDKDCVIDIYQAMQDGNWLKLIKSEKIESPRDIMKTFLLGGKPYLLTYEAKGGVFEFFKIGDDLTLARVYKYSKGYGADQTTGYTVVAPFAYRGAAYYLCYNIDTGKITIYQLSVPSDRPLQASLIYLHTWAQGWTRFAFFTLGAENFFLKTNLKYHNVNIDHIVDDPSKGGHPVGRHLDLPFDLDSVAPFYMNGGDPYFVTYKKNAETTYNKIYGNCLGWARQAEMISAAKCNILCPFTIGADQFILFY
jgi:hypothetical protein